MVDWKRTIVDPQSTSIQVFGGDVLNYIVQYHNDVDLAAGDPLGEVAIATKTTYDSSKFRLGDSGGDHAVDISLPNYSENKTINLPSTLPTSDDLVARTAVQILTGKTLTIDQNSLMHSTTNAVGDILRSNGTSYQRLPRGTANQLLTVNSGGTDILWTAAPGDVLLTGNQTLTNKTISAANNSITDSIVTTGTIMAADGTKFVGRPKGAGLQVLRTNSGATDIEWATLDNERVGKSTASGNGSTTIFNIAHGLASNPTYAFVDCSSHAIARTFTTNTANIIVTFATAPPPGTNNVIIYWRVVA